MRIAFVSHSRRRIGGVETYLDTVIPAIGSEHDVAFLYEEEFPDRDLIAFPTDASSWHTAQLGRKEALQQLKRWKPDVCFTQGLHDVELEAEIVALGNAVLYVHSYYGSCISGNKMIYNGVPKPCERKFGPACLLHYFPDRCGGRNPITMWQRFRLQSQRRELMREYRGLIVDSEHMRRELAQSGLESEVLYYPLPQSSMSVVSRDLEGRPLRLTFAGRMQILKGGHLLIDAVPDVQRRLGCKIEVVFIGDGPDRRAWEDQAAALTTESLSFKFTGWLSSEQINQELLRTHLLVMPSIWPEPFGLSGLEAGLHGIPAVAFAVGGVPEWLHDGCNGHVASGASTPANLADAMVRALSDPKHYQRLCAGAREEALKYDLQRHTSHLLTILSRCSA